MKNTLKLKDNDTVLVISEIKEYEKYINDINDLSKKYTYIILNGNFHKLNNYFLKNFHENVLYCIGDVDFINARKNNYYEIFDGYNQYELLYSNTKFLICCGGYKKNLSELEYSFIKSNWHINYNGELGYIISNYPKDLDKRYFKYSCAIGSENKIFCQEITKYGLKKLNILC